MGSLVPSRECGEATAVSVTSFHPDLVAEIGKTCFQALEFEVSRTVTKYIFYSVERAEELLLVFQKSALPL